jgi:hypothetical protein
MGEMFAEQIIEYLWKPLTNYQIPQSASVPENRKMPVDGQSDANHREGVRADTSKTAEGEIRRKWPRTPNPKQPKG